MSMTSSAATVDLRARKRWEMGERGVTHSRRQKERAAAAGRCSTFSNGGGGTSDGEERKRRGESPLRLSKMNEGMVESKVSQRTARKGVGVFNGRDGLSDATVREVFDEGDMADKAVRIGPTSRVLLQGGAGVFSPSGRGWVDAES